MTEVTTDAAFDKAAKAHATVVAQIEALVSEHRDIEGEAEKTQEEIKKLRSMYLPPEEMKHMVIEIANTSRERWEQTVRTNICQFITKVDTSVLNAKVEDKGKPMTFDEVETALERVRVENEYHSVLRLLVATAAISHDSPLYTAVGDAMGARLEEIMGAIAPEDMGYELIRTEDIGTSVAQLRTSIAALEEKLAVLRTRSSDVYKKLVALGHRGWPLGQPLADWMKG